MHSRNKQGALKNNVIEYEVENVEIWESCGGGCCQGLYWVVINMPIDIWERSGIKITINLAKGWFGKQQILSKSLIAFVIIINIVRATGQCGDKQTFHP